MDTRIRLGLRAGGLARGGRREQAGDQSSRAPDESCHPDDGFGSDDGGWSKRVRHQTSPAGRRG
jgi:hypothetical protein